MADTYFLKQENHVTMADENNTGNNMIWAIAMIIIVAIIAGAFYYGGFLNNTQKKEVDVEVKVPGVSNN